MWSGDRGRRFVLDALLDASDDPTVRRGTPFSLRIVPPQDDNDYIFSRLRTAMERGHPLSVELGEGRRGSTVRLCANGWARVLEVEHSSGWPQQNI